MEIVIRRRELLALAPNQRWDFPEEIAQQLIDRGCAEAIKPDVIEAEEKAEAKPKVLKVSKKA